MDGKNGRRCNIKGTPLQIAQAVQIICENIINLELNLNGLKKSN